MKNKIIQIIKIFKKINKLRIYKINQIIKYKNKILIKIIKYVNLKMNLNNYIHKYKIKIMNNFKKNLIYKFYKI